MTFDQLAAALRVPRKDHLRTRVTKLDSEKLILVHPVTGQLHVTSKGTKYVEQKRARATHLVAVEVRGSKAVSATFVPQ